ncbi:hypothetical protein Q8A73_011383 [Channa argus]|nr:hypothetical protein Q8A73_011383 [Channa argus]
MWQIIFIIIIIIRRPAPHHPTRRSIGFAKSDATRNNTGWDRTCGENCSGSALEGFLTIIAVLLLDLAGTQSTINLWMGAKGREQLLESCFLAEAAMHKLGDTVA